MKQKTETVSLEKWQSIGLARALASPKGQDALAEFYGAEEGGTLLAAALLRAQGKVTVTVTVESL